MLGLVQLDLTLRDDSHESVEVESGKSLDDELEDFLTRKGRYQTGWVPVRKGDSYVRYEEIVRVRAVP